MRIDSNYMSVIKEYNIYLNYSKVVVVPIYIILYSVIIEKYVIMYYIILDGK